MSYLDSLLFAQPLVLRLIIITVLMLLLAFVAWKKRALAVSGAIAAFFLGSLTMYMLGVSGLSVYLFFLISASLIAKLSRNVRGIDRIQKKGSCRDWAQVLSNGFIAAVAMALYYFTGRAPFLAVFVATLAESSADTWAGDIGILSKKPPFSILSFTPVRPGESGGISILGSAAGFASSVFFALLYLTLFDLKGWGGATAIIISSFSGMLFDSFLGATVQVHYYDEKEDLVTEKDEIDGRKLPVCRGFAFFDNDRVNLLSNIFTFILSLLLATALIR
jgi:Predicted membrane protein